MMPIDTLHRNGFLIKQAILGLILTLNMNTSSAQWQPLQGPFNCTVTSLLQVDSLIFAGTEHSGLYFSQDEGVTWNYLAHPQGLIFVREIYKAENSLYVTGVSKVHVFDLVTFKWTNTIEVPYYPRSIAHTGSHLWMINYDGELMSLDENTNSWIHVGGPEKVSLRYIFKLNGVIFISDYRQVWQWDSVAEQWLKMGNALTSEQISTLYFWGTTLIAGTFNHGILVLEVGSNTWENLPTGLPDSRIQVLSGDDNFLYAGSVKGFARTSDIEEEWELMEVPYFENWPGTLYATEELLFMGLHYGGILISADKGETWKYHNEGFHCSKINDMAIFNEYLYSAVLGGGIIRCHPDSQNCFYYNNGLESYLSFKLAEAGGQLFSSSLDSSLVVLDENNIWRPLKVNEKVFRARHLHGRSDTLWFNQVNSKYIYFYLPSSEHIDSILTPINSGGSNLGIYFFNDTMYLHSGHFSADHGQTWGHITMNHGDIIEGLYGNNNQLFGLGQRFLHRLNRDTYAWDKIYTFPVNSLIAFNEGLLSATYYNGIEFGTDQGLNWKEINEGLDNRFFEKLLIHDDYIYAGSRDRAIWRIPISEMAQLTPLEKFEPIISPLESPFPNPTASGATIPVSMHSGESVQLLVRDVNGRIVAHLHNGYLSTGDHVFIWNTDNVSPGIYIILFNSESQNVSHKIIVKN